MLEDLKLRPEYDGFLFLAESVRNPPVLHSHHHRELELNLVVRGNVTYVYGSRRITFGPRSLLWMFPSQEHQLVNRTGDAQYYVAVFKPEMIAVSCRSGLYRELGRKRVPGGKVLATELPPKTFGFLRQMMEQIMEGSLDADILNRQGGFGVEPDFRYYHSDPEGLNAGLRHLLLSCWRYQSRRADEAHAVALHPAINKALEILGEEEWRGGLTQLARECGLSAPHLSRVFARQVGVPLSHYRNSLRLSRFWEAYRAPARPTLMEAAFAADFGSYAQFYKVFSEAYGEGPRECLRGTK